MLGKSFAHYCHGEDPRVFEALGDTPALALSAMADLLSEMNVDWWTAASLSINEDGEFGIIIYE